MPENSINPLARELNQSLSLADSSPVQPDQEADLRAASQRLGIPLDTARSLPDETMKADRQAGFNSDDFAARFPSTARYLAGQDNALLSRDDIEPLSAVEQKARAMGTSLTNLGRSLGAAPFDLSSSLYGVLESAFALGSQFVGQPLAENRILPANIFAGPLQFFRGQRQDGAKIADSIAPDEKSMGLVESSINQGIRSLGQQLPGMAASVLTGNPVFALGAAGVQAGSPSATRAMDKGLTPIQAVTHGATDAVIEIGTEKIPVMAFINDMKVGSSFFKTLLRNQLTEQPGEQVATALQDFNEWATLRPEATVADYITERPEAMARTAIATLAGGVAQTGTFKGVQMVAGRANGRQQQAADAEAHAVQLGDLMAAASSSQTRARAPETFAQLVQQAAEDAGTAPTELFIDAQPLAQLLEQSGMNVEQIKAALPSVADQLQEALATDGQVAIPIGEAVTVFAGSDIEQELMRQVRTAPDGMSMADAESVAATADQLGEEAQQIIADQQQREAWDLSARAVFETMNNELGRAGRFSPDVNRAYASLVRDFYTVQAEKLGTTPEALYQQHPITVSAKLPGGRTVLNQAGTNAGGNLSLTGDEIAPIDADLKTLRAATRIWYENNLRNTSVVNAASGSQVQFDKAAKAFSTSANPDKLRLFAALKQIVEQGKIQSSKPPKDPSRESNVKAYHWLTADVEIGGRVLEVGVTLREDNRGNLYYNHNAIKAETPAPSELMVPAHEAGPGTKDSSELGGTANKAGAGTDDAGVLEQRLTSTEDGVNLHILSQAAQQATSRASFDPETLNIGLLEKADLSSFLHELGHAFFEISARVAAQPGAPAGLQQDMQILLDTVGYTGTLPEWLALSVDERRQAHETVAESFEQYLLEGKAPTPEQQTLFSKMRSWMVSVYRSLAEFLRRNGNAQLTDEVRGVFDRMLANDDAIAAARQARASLPLFATAEQAGMTAEQFAEYLRTAGDMNDEAVRDLDARSLRDMKWLRSAHSKALKDLQKDVAAKRSNARIEARRQLLQEPVYRALLFLRGRVDPAKLPPRAKGLDARRDDLETAIAKLGGLNKEAAIAEFGLDPKSFQTKIVGSPFWRAGKAGKLPDAMAEVLGEAGYLQLDQHGKYELNDLADMLHDQDRGISHYSIEADYDLIHGYKTIPVPADAAANPFAAGRLSRPELEERFAGQNVPWEKLGTGRRGMFAEVGMPMDAVAELAGFPTGEDMVHALLNVEPLQAATEARTDRIMLERYGDISSPEALQAAADGAIANEARARMIATEYARLNAAAGSPRAIQAAARQAALQVVAQQKIRSVRPDKSAAAGARAAKGAEQALSKGDVDLAAGYKRSQVLNSAIEREQRNVRAEIDQSRDRFSRIFRSDSRMAKNRDMNLVFAAREVLSRYGLAPDAAGRQAQGYLELLKRENPALADQIDDISGMLPEAKDYRDLTVEEFRGMRDAVLGLFNLAKRTQQTRIDGQLEEQAVVAGRLIDAIAAANGGKLGKLLSYDRTVSDADKLKVGALGFLAAGRRVEQWSDLMGADVKRIIFQQVSDAAVQARLARNDLIGKYRSLLAQIEPELKYTPISAPELGDGFVFTRGKTELLHALLHTGNSSNLRKLLLGRGWATTSEDGSLDTSSWDRFLQRMIADGVLTKADYDFAQGVWDLLETVKQDAQRAHFDIYGFYFNEITAEPVQTPFGEYRGGYVPAISDPLASADQAQKIEAEQAQQSGNSFMFPTTGRGFTRGRVEYNRPLELDLRTIASHLDKVSRFAHLEPAVRDTARLLMNPAVARALNGVDANIISKMLNPWLQRSAQQATTIPTEHPIFDKLCRAVRSRAGMYLMFANVVNTMQQVTGFSVAALKVPAPALLRAVRAYTTNPREITRQAADMSPWLRDRLDQQGYELSQQIDAILTNPNILQRGNEFMKRNAYFMQTGVQNVMDVVVWWGAYDHARAKMGASEQEAVRAADSAVRTTQGTFSPEDISAIEVQTAFAQLFTQFWGYFNMLANTLGGEAKKAVRDMGYMASTPRLLFIWAAGLMIPAFIGELIARGAPDDDDDEDGDGTLDEWLTMFFGSQAKTLAAMVPIAGGAAMAFANQLDKVPYNDRLNISPGLNLVFSSLGGLASVLQGEAFDDRLTKKEVRDVASLVAMATGAPTNLVAKPAGYVLDVESGRKSPDSDLAYAAGLVTGR